MYNIVESTTSRVHNEMSFWPLLICSTFVYKASEDFVRIMVLSLDDKHSVGKRSDIVVEYLIRVPGVAGSSFTEDTVLCP